MKIPSLPASTEPFLWGAAAGAIALAVVGFAWGGWLTGGSADKLAAARAEQAVVASLVPICVAEFRKHPEMRGRLTALKAIDSWEQTAFVERGGWAKMPGSEANRDVAEGCAAALAKLTL